ncbi:MAG: glutaredoxin domain-containing protein [Myxococcota bacterium]|nr:glutaredoxin domain-containing protein [Myxococcota bacterium]
MTLLSPRRASALLVLLALATGPACRDAGVQPAGGSEQDEATAPAPMVIDGQRDDLVFRFISRETGKVESATSVESIPESSRSEVVVFDALSPTPPGWEQVVNLASPLPATSIPTRGFILTPMAVSGGKMAVSKSAGSGAREVVMFSTQGCPHCVRARKFFKKEKVPFSEYDVAKDPKAQGRMEKLASAAGVPMSQLRGVPIIFVDGRPIVGFDKQQVQLELRRPR